MPKKKNFSAVYPDPRVLALIWVSGVRIRIGNVDMDP
jgi:hypothetical protein